MYQQWTKINLSPRCLSSMLQDKKRQNRKRNTTGSVLQENEQPYTTVPRPHYVVTKLSHVCLAHPLGAPALMLREKTNTNKPRQARQQAHRKKNKQPCTPRSHNVATNLRISTFALLSERAREPEPFSPPPFVFVGR